MTYNWQRLPFEKAIQKIVYTKKIPRKKFLETGAYPIISQESDFINGRWDDEADVFKVSSPVVIFGDHTKIIKHIDFDFVLGADGVKILKPIETLDSKFLAYFLESVLIADLGYARHYRLLKEISVPLPLIPEQKRIVAILELVFADIDKARANAEQNLKNAHELFESYLQQVFSQRGEGWVVKCLGDVCNFQNGFAFKSKDTVDESNTQLLRMGNLYQNVLNLDRKPSHYPDAFSEEYEQYLLQEGDLVISLTGTVGKEDYGFTVEIPKITKSLLLNQRIAKVINVDSSVIEKRFLFRVLRSRLFLDVLYSTANGTRQANLSTVTMRQLKINMPSIKKQVEICNRLDELEFEIKALEQIYATKLMALDELKKSILQKAFTGELTRTDAKSKNRANSKGAAA